MNIVIQIKINTCSVIFIIFVYGIFTYIDNNEKCVLTLGDIDYRIENRKKNLLGQLKLLMTGEINNSSYRPFL
jgi:hypothetical protein